MMAGDAGNGDVPDSKPSPRRRNSKPKKHQHHNGAALTNWTFAITSIIKLGGLVLAANEALFNPEPHDPVVFAVAAFMMAGAQGIDSFLSSMLGGRK